MRPTCLSIKPTLPRVSIFYERMRVSINTIFKKNKPFNYNSLQLLVFADSQFHVEQVTAALARNWRDEDA